MDYKNTYESNIKEYTVTELSNALKKTLEVNFDIIHLKGEVSGLTTAASGHVYLSLKDKNNSLIDGIIWKGQANRINFKLEDGMEVLVIGRLSTYAPRSKYNIIINSIEIAGEGVRGATSVGLFLGAQGSFGVMQGSFSHTCGCGRL